MADTLKSIVDLSKFTFTAEQIRDINELVFDEVLHAPDLNLIHTLYPGIVYDREIGFITGGGLVGKKAQGCDPTPHDFAIGTRKVTWQPKPWEVFIDECAEDLMNTAAVYALNKSTRVDDLTDTDYMAIVVKVLMDAVRDFMYRIVWFGDTDAANYDRTNAPNGIITPSLDVGYFNLLDGFFKQLQTAVTASPELLVSIAANGKTTKTEQMAGMDADAAFELLQSMYFKAPLELRSSGAMQFIVTQSVTDGYQKYLIGKGIESTYTNLVKGVRSLEFLGVKVIALPIWDKMIQAYNDLGTTYYKPHRALLIEKENLAIGTPSEEAYGTADVWYDKTSRKNYVLLKDKIDAKLLNDKRFVYAQ